MTDRERTLLILLVVVAVGIFGRYLLLPAWQEYRAVGERVRANVERIRRARRRISRLGSLTAETRRIEARLQRLRKRFPSRGEFHALMARLEEQARAAGIAGDRIAGFERTGTRDWDYVRTRIVRARFRGLSLDQVVRLLWRFNRRIPRLRVKSFDRFHLTMDRREGDRRFDLQFDLMVYTLKTSIPPPVTGD